MVIVPLELRVPVANLFFELIGSSYPLKLGSSQGVQPSHIIPSNITLNIE